MFEAKQPVRNTPRSNFVITEVVTDTDELARYDEEHRRSRADLLTNCARRLLAFLAEQPAEKQFEALTAFLRDLDIVTVSELDELLRSRSRADSAGSS